MNEKVTKLRPRAIYEYIKTYLDQYETINPITNKTNNNTKNTYQKGIELFFSYNNKDIKHLTPNDLYYTRKDIIDYQNYLHKERRYSYETIKTRLKPLRGLYTFLKEEGFDVNPTIFKPLKFPDDKKPYGFLSYDEAILLSELALEEREKKYEKNALLLLALYTSFRHSALFTITPSNIRPSEYNDGRYIIEVYDKGKKVQKEINQEMYDKLMYISKGDNKPFFKMTEKTVNSTIKRLARRAGFHPSRRITIHSFKKSGVDTVYSETQDIFAAQTQGNHSNVQTTLNYIKERPESKLLDIIEGQNIPEEIFEELTKDELIQLLKDTQNGTKITLKKKAKQMIERKEAY